MMHNVALTRPHLGCLAAARHWTQGLRGAAWSPPMRSRRGVHTPAAARRRRIVQNPSSDR